MINFSFSTVLMAILTCNVLIIIISFSLNNRKILEKIGYQLFFIFLILTILRLLVPFEFPNTTNIVLPDTLSKGVASFRHPFIYFGALKISVWFIFELIWFVGIIVNVVRYIKDYYFFKQYIIGHGVDVTKNELYSLIMKQVCDEKKKKNNFKIIEMSGINAPLLFGLFSPYILIPKSISLSEKELYYILSHEAAHYFNYDLIIKSGISLITIIYWWNPFSKTINSHIDSVLEMRIDRKLTYNDSKITMEYMRCLIQVAESYMESNNIIPKSAIPFIKNHNNELEKRFTLLCKKSEKKIQLLNYILILFVAGIYIISYRYIFEAKSVASVVEQNSEGSTTENTYCILKPDGKYDIYFNDIYIETTDTLEFYPNDILIINQ